MHEVELRVALERLVGRGALTAEQAALVLAEAGEGRRRLSPLAETAAYLGAVLAVIAAIVLATQFWAELEPWAQVALLAVTAGALWAAGRAVPAAEDPALDRLRGAVWVLSAAAGGGAALVGAAGLLDLPEAQSALVTGCVVTAYAAWLWVARPKALQLVALYGGALVVLLSAAALPERPLDEGYGLVLWAAGGGLGLLGWAGLLEPRRTAYALSAVSAAIGAQAVLFASRGPGLALGLGTAAALLAAGGALREPVLTGVAAVAVAVFLPQALAAWFPGSMTAPVLVLFGGLTLLAAALAAVRTARATDDPADGHAGDLGDEAPGAATRNAPDA